MAGRYDSVLFEPVEDMGILEGLVLRSLVEEGMDLTGLTRFRQTFERLRDEYLQAQEGEDAEKLDFLTKLALRYVPKYSGLETLNTDINLNPIEVTAYNLERGGIDRDQPGEGL